MSTAIEIVSAGTGEIVTAAPPSAVPATPVQVAQPVEPGKAPQRTHNKKGKLIDPPLGALPPVVLTVREFAAESDKAICLIKETQSKHEGLPASSHQIWFPKSKVTIEAVAGGGFRLTIPDEWAYNKGISARTPYNRVVGAV